MRVGWLFSLLLCPTAIGTDSCIHEDCVTSLLQLPDHLVLENATEEITRSMRVHKLLGQPGDGVQLHVVEHLRDRLLASPPRYFFAASTGHAGSTSLSQRAAYVPGPELDAAVFRFEDVGDLEDVGFESTLNKVTGWRTSGVGPKTTGHGEDGWDRSWKEWFDTRPSLDEQIDRVSKLYKPYIDGVLTDEAASSYTDLGHHNLHGMLWATPQVFGDDVFFLRLRRDRLHTAHSFSQYQRDLCMNMYRICPWLDDAITQPARGNWTRKNWESLTYTQQAFWFADEVEAQWQRLLSTYPNVSYVECDWVDDLGPCFEATAAVLGLEVAPQEVHKMEHTADANPLDAAALQQEDAQYQEFMSAGRV